MDITVQGLITEEFYACLLLFHSWIDAYCIVLLQYFYYLQLTRKLNQIQSNLCWFDLCLSLFFSTLLLSFFLFQGDFHWVKAGLFVGRLPPGPPERPRSPHSLLPAAVRARQPPAPQLRLPDLRHQTLFSPGGESCWRRRRKPRRRKPWRITPFSQRQPQRPASHPGSFRWRRPPGLSPSILPPVHSLSLPVPPAAFW